MRIFLRRLALSLAPMLFIFGLMLSIPVADAAPAPGLIGYDPAHITALGTFRPPGYDRQVLCIDARKTDPTKITTAIKEHSPFVAYAAHVYGQTTDPDLAAGYAVAVGRRINTNPDAIERALAALPDSTRNRVLTYASQITTEAEAFAGPYELPLKMAGEAEQFNAVGEIQVGVKSLATGKWVPGIGGLVSLENGRFSDGTNQKSVKTKTTPEILAFRASQNGKVVAKLAVTDLPPVEILIYAPEAEGYQRVMVDVGAAGAEVTAEVVAITTWTPKIETWVENPVVSAGSEIIDRARITNGRPGGRVSGVFEFYVQSDEPKFSKNIPDGARPFATVPFSAVFDRLGVVEKIIAKAKAPTVEPLGSGYFTIVAKINADPILGINPAQAAWGEPSETGLILRLEIATKVSADRILTGDSNSDNWVINGVVPNFRKVPLQYFVHPVLAGPLPLVDGHCPTGSEPWVGAPIQQKFAKQEIRWGEKKAADAIPGELATDKLSFALGEIQEDLDDGCYSYAGEVTVTSEGRTIEATTHELGAPTQGFLVRSPNSPTSLPRIDAGVGLPPAAIWGVGVSLFLVGALISRRWWLP